MTPDSTNGLEDLSSYSFLKIDPSDYDASWGPLEYARFRSTIIGSVSVTISWIVLTALVDTPERLLGSTELGLYSFYSVGVFPILASLVLIMSYLVDKLLIERNSIKSIINKIKKQTISVPWVRLLWVIVGAVGMVFIGTTIQTIDSSLIKLVVVWSILIGVFTSVVFWGSHWYLLDCEANKLYLYVVRGNKSFRISRTTKYLTNYRQIPLLKMNLFICSNRGEAWYNGPFIIPVSNRNTDTVAKNLQRIIDTESPIRADWSEKIIFCVFGFFSISIAPFFYSIENNIVVLILLGITFGTVGTFLIIHSLLI